MRNYLEWMNKKAVVTHHKEWHINVFGLLLFDYKNKFDFKLKWTGMCFAPKYAMKRAFFFFSTKTDSNQRHFNAKQCQIDVVNSRQANCFGNNPLCGWCSIVSVFFLMCLHEIKKLLSCMLADFYYFSRSKKKNIFKQNISWKHLDLNVNCSFFVLAK